MIRDGDGQISFATRDKQAACVRGVVNKEWTSIVVDSASTANLISLQFITRHSKLSAVKKMSSGYEAMLANGDEFVSHDLIMLEAKLAGLVYQVEFMVVEKPPNDMVLGISFLINTKSNVDFWNDKLVFA